MANLKIAITTEGEIAIVAATPKTLLQAVAPANQRGDLRSWSVGFDGISPTAEAVTIELLRQTTAGTMSAATPVKDGAGAETIQFTAQKNATVEPTASDVLARYEHHPQAGSFVEKFDKGECEIPGGTRLGIRVTVPTGGANLNATAFMKIEE
jgi:hypothetical protein